MQEGDFVKIRYVGRIADTDEIFDLTEEDLAKKENVFTQGHKYGPALIVVGSGMIIKGVEKELEHMKIGDEKDIDVSVDEAFGPRKPELIKIVSMAKFKAQNINPVPGEFVTIEHVRARIQSVSGGRVRVDFNHPLAGKQLKYWVKLENEITGNQNKIEAILEYFFIEGSATIEKDTVTITVKSRDDRAENVVRNSITAWMKDIKTVNFKQAEKEKPTASAQKK